MARIPSKMLPLGTPLPKFELTDVASGRKVASAEFEGAPLVVAVICNHCPFVKNLKFELADFGRFCESQGVACVAINPNDTERYPDDNVQNMQRDVQEFGYPFPYLLDEDQSVAKAFRAVCTPEFYLFDRQGKLAYRGQFDDSRPGNGIKPSGADLKAAVTAVIEGRTPPEDQKPSVGCSVKWRPGNEPDYVS